MPVPASAHALCCWEHLALTALTQKGFGVLRYLEWSRLMLVLLGAPLLHTIKALVRGDASTNFGSCPVLMGHLVRKASAIVGPW